MFPMPLLRLDKSSPCNLWSKNEILFRAHILCYNFPMKIGLYHEGPLSSFAMLLKTEASITLSGRPTRTKVNYTEVTLQHKFCWTKHQLPRGEGPLDQGLLDHMLSRPNIHLAGCSIYGQQILGSDSKNSPLSFIQVEPDQI